MDYGVCKEPTSFYLLAVALRSFFLVLATHLLAGEVDTSLAGAPLARRISWWFRYYNPLNLSWRYYSMFAYRFTAHSWGTHQLALINHEEHPLLPPVPYIIGETVHPLHVRRLEMAGILSSQGILTFSAAYQGVLAIQYAISTEGIPYLPNTTVPLAMVGLFRVMASKWVASKIHVDAYPYPCMPSASPSLVHKSELNLCASLSRFLQFCKSSIVSLSASSPTVITTKDSSSTLPSMVNFKRNPLSFSSPVPKSQMKDSPSTFLSIPVAHNNPSPPTPPDSIIQLNIDKSSSPSINTLATESLSSSGMLASLASIHLPHSHLPPLLIPSSTHTFYPPSPVSQTPSVLQSPNRPLLPTICRPYSTVSLMHSVTSVSKCNTGTFPVKSLCTYSPSLSMAHLLPPSTSPSIEHHANTFTYSPSSLCTTFSSIPCSQFESSRCPHPRKSPISLSGKPSQGYKMHAHTSPEQPLPYKSNKIMVGVWMSVLVALVTMSFLPYKVAAAYQLPHRLLQFSMQIFYQYIAVSEFVFHGYLLYQGPRALANRVLFFDHWTFKAQTAGFFCLLMYMMVVALLDFVKHEFYRTCA